MDIRTISCYECGRTYHGITETRSELRAVAENEGWSTAIPIWATASPAVPPDVYYRDHPEHRRKTVDNCPDCLKRGILETLAAMQQQNDLHRLPVEQRTAPDGNAPALDSAS